MSKYQLYAFADEADPMVDGQIAAMLRNKLQGLEIRGVDNENISAISPEKALEVRKKLDNAGLICWSVGSPIGKIEITDDFAPHLDQFRRTLDNARILGAANMRIFSFYIPQGSDPLVYRDEVLSRMTKLLDAAKGSGVKLCHENEKGIYGAMPEQCLDLLQTLPELGGIFGPANFIQCGADPLAAWQLLKNRIDYMHIKDCIADGSVVPAGKGVGNLPIILKEYLELGGMAMTMEPHLTIFSGLDALERAGEESQVGTCYTYPDSNAAFDDACRCLREII